jgi:hypothetical protein
LRKYRQRWADKLSLGRAEVHAIPHVVSDL